MWWRVIARKTSPFREMVATSDLGMTRAIVRNRVRTARAADRIRTQCTLIADRQRPRPLARPIARRAN